MDGEILRGGRIVGWMDGIDGGWVDWPMFFLHVVCCGDVAPLSVFPPVLVPRLHVFARAVFVFCFGEEGEGSHPWCLLSQGWKAEITPSRTPFAKVGTTRRLLGIFANYFWLPNEK